uniref:non-specific serine/threonine protein kinase n=1 Tax=Magnetococcus massalia (strain MO-1) TaxID=451514 RepID=A0A1S7LH60_MAGMO|nr:putative Serine/threonine protein kinase [Candidatus Magnetococcus massalia]
MAAKKFNDSLPSGATILWYEIIKVLGKGGFGITYLAKDTNLDQLVAIKEYLPSAFASRDNTERVMPNSPEAEETFRWGLDRFLTEARTVARFRHPHIVKVLSFFEDHNTAYMVMEYAEGKGLDAILKQRKTLTESQLRQLTNPLLSALETLHKTGFIHRDLKPANIMIRKDGKPIILDFGSAREALGDGDQQMTSLLTLGYSPFEQYDSSGARQGPWTDIYAMGAVLYHAVTGKKPMDAALRINAKLRNQQDPMLPAVDVCSDGYSKPFLAAIDHALGVLETDRPQCIEDWKKALFDGQATKPGKAAQKPSSKQPSTKPSTKRVAQEKPAAEAAVTSSPKVEETKPVADKAESVEAASSAKRESASATAKEEKRAEADASQDENRERAKSSNTTAGPKKKNPWRSFIASINDFGTVSNGQPAADKGAAAETKQTAAASAASQSAEQEAPKIPQSDTPCPEDPQLGDQWQEPITGLTFVWAPEGHFLMGSHRGVLGWRSDEAPAHPVSLDGFWICKTPVTWGAWNQVMRLNGLRERKDVDPDLPASGIGWEDAQSYIRNFSRVAPARFRLRLPREAEWEFAARAGSDAPFYFGEDMTLLDEHAWYTQNAFDQPHGVGQKAPNALGLHDMLGNVWEWVEDWYSEGYYKKCEGGVSNPRGAPFGDVRVSRGGSWRSPVKACRVAYRNRVSPTSKSPTLGMRLVLETDA